MNPKIRALIMFFSLKNTLRIAKVFVFDKKDRICFNVKLCGFLKSRRVSYYRRHLHIKKYEIINK